MYLINKVFKDIINSRGESNLQLKTDTPISPYHMDYPILWTGFLNNEKIKIKQKSSWSSHIPEFEFLECPNEYSYLQQKIVKEINNYLKILD